MATTMYFEGTVKDKKRENAIELEFGRSSFYGENSLYLEVDGKHIVLDYADAKKLINSMMDVGQYLRIVD
ncbi:hypothetical protein Q4574_00885 [Aliiglaciecola sp. 3_MG-2023]|uniref:hypothetical protein n=1 Tax=Aliiglaciecola sp. 3_MG-2023 TaxID=3062644 RepID=UPI0026E114C6|nr:hypothetical protein [Aliiglaciecola sp. 3_MG-2023]MDO6691811.1 hypothetical protein [Aliiglaciecola sp. 3_MG-2023]